MRYEIIPGTPPQRFVCSGNSAYGMVRVRDTVDPAHPEYDARVDLSWDATHQARITVNAPTGAVTENIDDAFLSAYQGLARITGGGTPDQQAYCRDMHAEAPPVATPPPAAAPTRDTLWWGWMGVPALGAGAQYLIDRTGRHDLDRIPAPNDFGGLGTTADAVYIGGQVLFVASYIPLHRRMSPTVAWVADGLCLGGTLGFGIAAGVQPRGEGTPELSMATTLGSTCIPAMIYGNNETSRDPRRFWPGFATQLAFSGLELGLGFGGVGARPSVSGASMYAPASLPPGSRNVPGNPYEAVRYPGIDTDMKILGFAQAGGAAFNLLNYLLFDGNAPVVTAAPVPGGAVVGVSGTLP